MLKEYFRAFRGQIENSAFVIFHSILILIFNISFFFFVEHLSQINKFEPVKLYFSNY